MTSTFVSPVMTPEQVAGWREMEREHLVAHGRLMAAECAARAAALAWDAYRGQCAERAQDMTAADATRLWQALAAVQAEAVEAHRLAYARLAAAMPPDTLLARAISRSAAA